MITLAPTVTLWDAGEFITAAKVLGVPHPPGTPLFVLMGHVWAQVVRIGGYAWRLNLMSASFSAGGAGCLFLVAHQLLAGEARWLRIGGAAAAAVLSAFAFTAWQNSNETEVYTVATFSIAAICWLCVRWRDVRAPRLLLLIVYLAALSLGNHLLALLVGPAVSLFILYTLRSAPAADPDERRRELGEWGVLTALWFALIAVGLGSTALLYVSGALVALAVGFCLMRGSRAFPVLAVGIAVVGISVYAFLYIRAGLQPLLDEADPATWKNLVAVIRREQFGSRGVFDNPLFPPGQGNPGRTLLLFGEQLLNFFQYCSWQWARALPTPAMVLVALVFVLLGVGGFDFARRRDAGVTWLLGALWVVTGLGLVVYMNFKPGFSLFWNQYTVIDQHEVRERDYFFVVSFQVWGVFAAFGLVRLLHRLGARLGAMPRWAIGAAGLVALLPFAANVPAASRRGRDATVARDFAYDLLQSVEPYGVLFAFGDNDTFPVWYLQEVEGVRQDVTLVNLSLANLRWYLHQLATRPVRLFDPSQAPAVYRALAPAAPPSGAALTLSAAQIDSMEPVRISDDGMFTAGAFALPVHKGQFLRTADQVILYIIATYVPSGRPVTFGVSSGRGRWLGLDPSLVYQGLAFKVVPRADTVRQWTRGIQGTMLDTARTAVLVDSVFRLGALLGSDSLDLEPAAQQVATSLSLPFLELGSAAAVRGDRVRALAYLRTGYHLNPSATLAGVIQRLLRP